jgi:beta-phosphoglucomutase-like phosphatase (HAD superfamily)
MTKGIIFDMDGTMVDNMMIHHRAWQRKLAELGLDFTLQEVMAQIHGVNDEILVRLFGERFTAAERQQIAAEKEAAYREIFLPELKLIDGLPQFLDQLQQAGVPLVIGTAAPVENMDFILDELHLRPYFRAAFHAGDVSHGKPPATAWCSKTAPRGSKPPAAPEARPWPSPRAMRRRSLLIFRTCWAVCRTIRGWLGRRGGWFSKKGIKVETGKSVKGKPEF